jgi:hypothetical protein
VNDQTRKELKAELKKIQHELAHDRQTSYMPENNAVTGSIEATILLQRAISIFMNNEKKPFVMLMGPSDHIFFTYDERNWSEVIGFTPEQVKKALSTIGTEIPSPETKRGKAAMAKALKKTDPTGLIIYWIDCDEPWYMLNKPLAHNLGIVTQVTWTETE